MEFPQTVLPQKNSPEFQLFQAIPTILIHDPNNQAILFFCRRPHRNRFLNIPPGRRWVHTILKIQGRQQVPGLDKIAAASMQPDSGCQINPIILFGSAGAQQDRGISESS